MDDLQIGGTGAGIVLCHGYAGIKDLYLLDTAQALNRAGYVVMTFDYKGWEGEGSQSPLVSYGRVLDIQVAMTYFPVMVTHMRTFYGLH